MVYPTDSASWNAAKYLSAAAAHNSGAVAGWPAGVDVQPAPMLRRMEPSVQAVLERVRAEAPQPLQLGAAPGSEPAGDAVAAAGER